MSKNVDAPTVLRLAAVAETHPVRSETRSHRLVAVAGSSTLDESSAARFDRSFWNSVLFDSVEKMKHLTHREMMGLKEFVERERGEPVSYDTAAKGIVIPPPVSALIDPPRFDVLVRESGGGSDNRFFRSVAFPVLLTFITCFAVVAFLRVCTEGVGVTLAGGQHPRGDLYEKRTSRQNTT